MNITPVRLAEHPELSLEATLVKDTLVEQGLETPMIETGLSSEQKYERIKGLMTEVMDTLGLDLRCAAQRQLAGGIHKVTVPHPGRADPLAAAT